MNQLGRALEFFFIKCIIKILYHKKSYINLPETKHPKRQVSMSFCYIESFMTVLINNMLQCKNNHYAYSNYHQRIENGA